MISWPAILPIPSQNYSGSSDPHLVTTEFEVGTRQRRMYSQEEDSLKVSWLMSQLQFDTFRYFVRTSLNGGSLAFQTSILGLNGVEVAEVYLKAGKFNFSTNAPGYVVVSAELIRVQPTVMDAELYELLNSDPLSSPDGFSTLSDALFLYIETAYGTSAADSFVQNFMFSHGY